MYIKFHSFSIVALFTSISIPHDGKPNNAIKLNIYKMKDTR